MLNGFRFESDIRYESEMARATARTAPRPYVLLYRPGRENFCPGCGHTHWYVGRSVAECAFCAAVLPLHDSVLRATGVERPLRELVA